MEYDYPYMRSYNYLLFSYHLIVDFFRTVKIGARASVYLHFGCRSIWQRNRDLVCGVVGLCVRPLQLGLYNYARQDNNTEWIFRTKRLRGALTIITNDHTCTGHVRSLI